MSTPSSDPQSTLVGFPIEDFRAGLIAGLQNAWSVGSSGGLVPAQSNTLIKLNLIEPNGDTDIFSGYFIDFQVWDPVGVASFIDGICSVFRYGWTPGEYSFEFEPTNEIDPLYFFADPDNPTNSELLAYADAFQDFQNLWGDYTSTTLDFTLYARGQALEGSDFTGDGYDDILFFNPDTRTVGQFSMVDGSWQSIGNAGVGWEVKGFGRFDGDDNSIDILWFNATTRAVGRFDMENGVSTGWNSMGRAGAGWEVVTSGDFNGDDIDDVLWYNSATGSVGQYRLNSSGQADWRGIGSLGSGFEAVGVADINADGIDDVLLYNEDTRTLGHFRMSPNSKSWGGLTTLGEGYEFEFSGDFNGDGHDDLLVVNAGTRKLGFYDMADDSATWTYLGGFGAGWSVEGTGDFNGDGNDDIVWRHTDGRVGQYLMDGANRTWDLIAQAGEAWDIAL